MRFMVLIRATQDTEAGIPPTVEAMSAMERYGEELIKAGVLLDGGGLRPSSKSARVKFSGTKPSVIDGPFAEAKELVAGYMVMEVKSLDEAIEWVKRCPMPSDSEIEIRPYFQWVKIETPPFFDAADLPDTRT